MVKTNPVQSNVNNAANKAQNLSQNVSSQQKTQIPLQQNLNKDAVPNVKNAAGVQNLHQQASNIPKPQQLQQGLNKGINSNVQPKKF